LRIERKRFSFTTSDEQVVMRVGKRWHGRRSLFRPQEEDVTTVAGSTMGKKAVKLIIHHQPVPGTRRLWTNIRIIGTLLYRQSMNMLFYHNWLVRVLINKKSYLARLVNLFFSYIIFFSCKRFAVLIKKRKVAS
jgi:hypothetical protein